MFLLFIPILIIICNDFLSLILKFVNTICVTFFCFWYIKASLGNSYNTIKSFAHNETSNKRLVKSPGENVDWIKREKLNSRFFFLVLYFMNLASGCQEKEKKNSLIDKHRTIFDQTIMDTVVHKNISVFHAIVF